MQVGVEGMRIAVTDELANSRFRHPPHDQLANAGRSEQMRMQRQPTLLCVVVNGMLKRIDGKRATTSDPFEGHKDLIPVGKQVATLLLEIGVEGGKRVAVHVDGPCHSALTLSDVDASMAAFDIFEPNGDGLADAQTTDPHEQDEGAVSPGRKDRKEGLQILLGDDIGHTVGLSAIQTRTTPSGVPIPLQRSDRIVRKTIWIEQVKFGEQRGNSGQTTINRHTGQASSILRLHEREATLSSDCLKRDVQ